MGGLAERLAALLQAHPEQAGLIIGLLVFAESLACDNGELAVTVVDRETGEQHCFRIDLDSGEAGAC